MLAVKKIQSFTVICRKLHVANSICLRATIFQNPEGTLWTHCIYIAHHILTFWLLHIRFVFRNLCQTYKDQLQLLRRSQQLRSVLTRRLCT
jgi:hypothetical protein